MSDVIPFREMMDPNMPQNGFLFGDAKGPWDTDQITKVLASKSLSKLGFRITFRIYRQLNVAMNRKFLQVVCEDDDDEFDDDDDRDYIDDLMAAHETRTTITKYAPTKEFQRYISPDGVDLYRIRSDKWVIWIGLIPRILEEMLDIFTRIVPELTPPIEERLESVLGTMFGASGRWRSNGQKEGLRNVLEGVSPLVVILPTGGGKSLLFMGPAKLPNAGIILLHWLLITGTTVVITPLVALANNMLDRCRDAGIDSYIWGKTKVKPWWARVILVVADSAMSSTCARFILNIQLAKRLDRIFLDEAHKFITDIDYRPKLGEMYKFTFTCPIDYLTATFPPTMKEEFEKNMHIRDVTYVREVTCKPNMEYSVKQFKGDKFLKSFLELVQEKLGLCEDTDKVYFFFNNLTR